MTRSDTLLKLLPALIAARNEMPRVIKDSENPHFRSKYADLAGCLEACEPSLGKHGLAVLQTPRWADGSLSLETTLAHISGEWISSEYPMPADYSRPQTVGAALTYARRYAYLCIVGKAPEDDDGETAMGRGSNGHASRPAPPQAPRNGNGNGHQANGNGHGHAKPSGAWGSPGNPKSAAPAVAPRPAPAATPGSDRVPVSGRSLWRWAAEIEKTNGTGLIAHMIERGNGLGWGKKLVDWTPDQVADAFNDAQECLDIIYGAHDGDGSHDGGDDGRYDDRGDY